MSEELLPPFPPSSGWCTVRNVLHEVFADAHLPRLFGPQQFETPAVTLFAPIYRVDELIAGISAESMSPVGDLKHLLPISDYVSRFIFNSRTGCYFELTLDENQILLK